MLATQIFVASALSLATTATAASGQRGPSATESAVSDPTCANQPTEDDKAGMAQMRNAQLTPGEKPDLSALMNSPQAKAYLERANARQRTDWANLCQYRSANIQLREKGRPKIIFLGDSITENWTEADPALFTKGVVGRGISGQTSSQMLLRFFADVVTLKPKVVHILAGTNDIAANTGPISDEDFKNNIRAMVELAQANHIAVIIASITPSSGMSWVPGLQPAKRISGLNEWLASYANERHAVYVNYYAVLTDARGGLRADLGNDGVHPNRNGYAMMAGLAQHAIAKAQGVTARR